MTERHTAQELQALIDKAEQAKARRDDLAAAYKGSLAITPVKSKAVRELIEVGLIPAECTHFELILDRNSAIVAKSTFYVTEAQLQQIADAIKKHPEEVSQILKTSEVLPLGINEPRKRGAE